MNLARVLLLIITLTILLVGIRYWNSSKESVATSAPPSAPEIAATTEVREAADRQQPPPDVTPVPADEPACLSRSQFESLPEVIQDAARMESVAVTGTAMSVYESLDEGTLRGFADQGDSAAMAVIGAINIMRAYGLDESMAMEWLNHQQVINDLDLGNSQLSSKASLSLNEAAYWFYEAAMHGRLLALQNYGRARGRLFGGPVGLGWLSQEEYDTLSPIEKTSLAPANLYAQVAYDIAPALREGVLGGLSRVAPQSTVQEAIRAERVAEFERAVADRGLPAISVPAAASPQIEALLDQVCDAEIEEFLRRRGMN